jgi:hypothetical protein
VKFRATRLRIQNRGFKFQEECPLCFPSFSSMSASILCALS